jgi:hypothetical protein
LRRGERLMEFYARTGLEKSQILTMTKSEISEFVDNVSKNIENQEHVATQRMFEPRRAQTRYIFT